VDFNHDRDDRDDRGRALKWLSVVDEYTRECPALEVERGLTADDVVNVLIDLFVIRGEPVHLRSDNGGEFIAAAIGRLALLVRTPSGPTRMPQANDRRCSVVLSLGIVRPEPGRFLHPSGTPRHSPSLGATLIKSRYLLPLCSVPPVTPTHMSRMIMISERVRLRSQFVTLQPPATSGSGSGGSWPVAA
jgi:hypothetical protein